MNAEALVNRMLEGPDAEPQQTVAELPAAPNHCTCDESHQISDTVCDWCREHGRVHFNDPAP